MIEHLAWPVATILISIIFCCAWSWIVELKIDSNHDLENRVDRQIRDLNSTVCEEVLKIKDRINHLEGEQRSFDEAKETITKQAEYVQKMISQQNIAAAFGRK
jgi:hypothetical protein